MVDHARLLAVALLLVPAVVGGAEPDLRHSIVVTGQGEVKAAPDRVEISFAVETVAPRAAEAAAENARRSAAVTTALKAVLAPADTVSTTRYAIEPRYEQPKPGEAREPRISGYVARNEVQVQSGQVDKAGALLDAGIGAGANRVGGLQSALAQRAELQRQAIEKAGADARAQADSVARGLGVHVKAVLSATTGTSVTVMPRRFEAAAFTAEARTVPTPIEPGELTVPATLQVTYEIE